MLLRNFLLTISICFVMASDASAMDPQFAESNVNFTKSSYNILRNTPGNLFYSPISIEAVLALAHAGAAGNTAKQIQKGIHLPETREASAKQFGAFIDLIENGDSDVILKLANGVYTDKKYVVKQDYLDLVKKDFKAELGLVDFSESDKATDEINAWVAEKTNDKIPELFAKGILNSLTRAVLLNAVYFKGNWEKQFPVSDTQKGVFHLNEKDTKEVDFMTLKANFRVRGADDAHIIELPYKGKSVSMIVVVPKEINGLAAVEERLVNTDLKEELVVRGSREVQLKIPKFKMEQTLELNELLEKLGLTDMFRDDLADFSGMSEQPIVVSKAIQKAFIEVNEQGSEAAAATGLKMAVRSMRPALPLEIIANQPFLFYIKYDEYILFSGRIVDPKY